MADEITLAGSLQVNNGNHHFKTLDRRFQDDQSAIGAHGQVVDVGTTEEAMPIGDVSSEGWLELTNLDDTNYVDWGPDSGGSMVGVGRLEPGHTQRIKMIPGTTIRWVANTAAVKVEMLLLER